MHVESAVSIYSYFFFSYLRTATQRSFGLVRPMPRDKATGVVPMVGSTKETLLRLPALLEETLLHPSGERVLRLSSVPSSEERLEVLPPAPSL